MEPQTIAIIILLITYIVLFSEIHNRAVVALIGAGMMIITGVITQQQAIDGIDFNTIFLLIGMMIVVGITEKSGIFEAIAIWCTQLVKGNPRGLLIMLPILTAIFSALLDNVTTILLIVPITFKIVKILESKPYPYIISEIFASNIGGTATLIGDPPNILIGSALKLGFMDFVRELTPIVVINMLILLLIFDFVYKKSLIINKEKQNEILMLKASNYITDMRLMKMSIPILCAVIAGFIMAERWHLENGSVALFGASILLFLYGITKGRDKREQRISVMLSNIDWTTIFFFAGLFVMVHGLSETGVLTRLGEQFLQMVDGSVQRTTFYVLWISAGLSAVIDNIPFVATMIPMIKSIETELGGREAMMPVWWALSLGACFGGNGSLIAASANVIAAGLAEKEGCRIKFGKFLLWAIPITFISILLAHVYLFVLYFAFYVN